MCRDWRKVAQRAWWRLSVCFGLGCTTLTAQQLPAPSGPAAVGTLRVEWRDSSRIEMVEYLARDVATGRWNPAKPSGARRLVVQFWYPAAPGGGRTAAPVYNSDLPRFGAGILDSARAATYRAVRPHATPGALIAPGAPLPVLLFSPGSSTFLSDYTSLFEDLASHGYVVAAIGHPGITLVSFEDGLAAVEWAGWRPPTGMSQSLDRDSLRASAAHFATTRDRTSVADVRFVLDRLASLGRDPATRPLADRLDLTRVGAFGHSTGAAVVVSSAQADPRIRAVMAYDVLLPQLLFGEPLSVPLAVFRTDDTRYPPGWADRQGEVYSRLAAPAFDLLLRGGGHNSFGDRALLFPQRFAYRVDPAQGIALVRTLTRAFFDDALGAARAVPLHQFAVPSGVVLTRH
jgi:predicted dienelactone hydrolase